MPSAPRRGATMAIAFALVAAPQNPTHSRDSRLAAKVRRTAPVRATVLIVLNVHGDGVASRRSLGHARPLCGCPEQILL